MKKFIIFSLPRSRSAWLHRFLSYGANVIGHDLAVQCETISDFLSAFEPLDGTIETGAVLGWPLVKTLLPQTKIIVIRRSLRDVLESLARCGLVIGPDIANDLHSKAIQLEILASQSGVDVYDFHQLEDAEICARLFESVLRTPHNPNWYRTWAKCNVQIDMAKRIATLQSNSGRLGALRAEVANAVRRGMN